MSFLSFWLYNIFIHTDYIEYVIKNMSFCHSGSTLSTSLWHYGFKLSIFLCFLYCILYLYMYEKATRYQWFEEKSLSLQQNQLS